MIDHLSLGTTDLSRSVEFYRWAFAPLGFVLQHANEKEAAFGPASVFGQTDRGNAPRVRRSDTVGSGRGAAARVSGGTTVREPGERPDIGADKLRRDRSGSGREPAGDSGRSDDVGHTITTAARRPHFAETIGSLMSATILVTSAA
jgi:catechol 2,3-dioxygenase-like lactoylglutathione lyase family enzyme